MFIVGHFVLGLLSVLNSVPVEADVGIVLSSASGNVTVRSTVLLVCVAGGSGSTPVINWHFNGTRISNTSTKHTVYNNSPLNMSESFNFVESILEICNIGFSDHGDYVCTADDETTRSNTTITVTVLETEVGIVLSSVSGDVDVRSTVLLVCVAGGSYTPVISWQFNGTGISNTSTKHTVYSTPLNLSTSSNFNLKFVESILEICNIGFSNQGSYVCTSTVDNGAAESNTTIIVNVLEIPIQVNITGRSQMLTEMDILELNCTASPSARLTWQKRIHTGDSETVETQFAISRRLITNNEAGSIAQSTLVIRSVIGSDSAIYVCIAENADVSSLPTSANYTVIINAVNECERNSPCLNDGTCTDYDPGYFCTCPNNYEGTNCEQPVKVIIEKLPVITQPPVNTELMGFGTPVNLTCTAEGHPPPIYRWYKDGNLIPDEIRPFIYILDPQPGHRGNYSCSATNSLGTTTSEPALLNISGLIQFSANISFSIQVNEDNLLTMISNGNHSNLSVYSVKVLSSLSAHNRWTFILLITLVNISSSSSPPERATVLKAVESNLMSVVHSLPMVQLVHLKRHDGCNPETDQYGVWPETLPGFTATLPCPCADILRTLAGRATRLCRGTYTSGAEWEDVNNNECSTHVSATTARLCEIPRNISDAPIEEQINASRTIEEVTSDTENLMASDISASVATLVQLTQGATTNTQLRENYLQAIDNIQKVNPETVLDSQRGTGASVMVLESLERFQDKVVLASENSTENATNTFAFKTFAMQIEEIDPETYQGQSFSVELGSVQDAKNITGKIPADSLKTSDATREISTSNTASIKLPEHLFKYLSSCSSPSLSAQARVSYSVFLSDVLFQNEDQRHLELGSLIVAARLQCDTNTTILVNDLIEVSFKINKMVQENSSNHSCASWNTDLPGAWSFANCEEKEGNEGKREYSPTMTTEVKVSAKGPEEEKVFAYRQFGHFGILFDLRPNSDQHIPEIEAIALEVITYVGLIISLLCLTVFVISYFCLKKLRNSIHGQILINMSLALMGLYIVFLISAHATPIKVLCGISSGLLHYFFLVFFGWTTVEVFWLYIKLVKIFGVQSLTARFIFKAGLPTWIVPLLIVALSAGLGSKYYYNPLFCRMTEWPFWFGMILPFLLAYLINWIVFFIIMISICKHTQGPGDIKDSNKLTSVKKNVVIALTLAVIFGLGWGIGLAATSGPPRWLTLTFQILFSLLVGFQGTLIFILHGIRNKDVRNLWKQCFSRIGGKSLLDNLVTKTKTSSAALQSSTLHSENVYSSDTMTLTKKPISDESEHIDYDKAEGENTKVDLTKNL